MCLDALGEGFLVFPGGLGGGLQKTIVSNKAVPEVLNVKFRRKFKNGFTNRGCLHCAILKALHGFKKKRTHKAIDV